MIEIELGAYPDGRTILRLSELETGNTASSMLSLDTMKTLVMSLNLRILELEGNSDYFEDPYDGLT